MVAGFGKAGQVDRRYMEKKTTESRQQACRKVGGEQGGGQTGERFKLSHLNVCWVNGYSLRHFTCHRSSVDVQMPLKLNIDS